MGDLVSSVGNRPFGGLVDDVRIYWRGLLDAEITALAVGIIPAPWPYSRISPTASAETLIAFKRAGCSGVLTYHAAHAAKLLNG